MKLKFNGKENSYINFSILVRGSVVTARKIRGFYVECDGVLARQEWD